jgi:hypothetical protein
MIRVIRTALIIAVVACFSVHAADRIPANLAEGFDFGTHPQLPSIPAPKCS